MGTGLSSGTVQGGNDLRSHGLAIQESLLTGESLPVEKHTKAVSEDAGLGDRECLAFSGTSVTAGQGS